MAMSIDQSIVTALEYETRVAAVYEDAAGMVADEAGRRVLAMLAREERFHVKYLEQRLAEWKAIGKVIAEKLDTVVPPKARIDEGVAALTAKASPGGRDSDLQVLRKALDVEHETSAFYRRMVAELPEEGKALYRRFVEIEEGHGLIVQAEIDALSKAGFWYEFRETDQEEP